MVKHSHKGGLFGFNSNPYAPRTQFALAKLSPLRLVKSLGDNYLDYAIKFPQQPYFEYIVKAREYNKQYILNLDATVKKEYSTSQSTLRKNVLIENPSLITQVQLNGQTILRQLASTQILPNDFDGFKRELLNMINQTPVMAPRLYGGRRSRHTRRRSSKKRNKSY